MGDFHALVVDYDLAVGTAASIVKAAAEIDPHLPVVIISRHYEDVIFSEVTRMGADSYYPVTESSLRMFPDTLLKRVEARTAIRDAVDAKYQSLLRSHQLEILASLVRKMVETNDLKSVMQEMAEQVVKRLNMKVVSLQKFFPDQNGFAAFGIYPRGKLVKFAESVFSISLDSFVFPFDPDNCIVDRYTLERRPWVGNDFAEVFGPSMPARAARMIQKFAGVKSIYNAPFYGKDKLLGGLVVGNVRTGFTDVEMEAFDAIVHISSLLFEYNESNQAQSVHAERLKAVRQAIEIIQKDDGIDIAHGRPAKFLDTVCRKLVSAVPADVIAFFEYDRVMHALVLGNEFGRSGKGSKSLPQRLSVDGHRLGRAAVSGETLLENNFELNPEAHHPTRRRDRINLLAVPLGRDTGPIGMIVLTRSLTFPFVDSDREVIELFASQFDLGIISGRD